MLRLAIGRSCAASRRVWRCPKGEQYSPPVGHEVCVVLQARCQAHGADDVTLTALDLPEAHLGRSRGEAEGLAGQEYHRENRGSAFRLRLPVKRGPADAALPPVLFLPCDPWFAAPLPLAPATPVPTAHNGSSRTIQDTHAPPWKPPWPVPASVPKPPDRCRFSAPALPGGSHSNPKPPTSSMAP
jgi:hypothetical protein